jgi:ABC-type cobalamin/Fe3+-siderophores transport system ATPase subunit
MAQQEELNQIAEFARKYVSTTKRHIFLTGKAGTGKTTFLRNIARFTHKNTVIAAPTGIAAINTGSRSRTASRRYNAGSSCATASGTRTGFPQGVTDDFVHITLAAVYGMDYLLTWNCAHIANPHWQSKIATVLQELGYAVPVLCTPQALLEGESP